MTGEFDPLDVKKVSESQKCAQSVLSSNERHKFDPLDVKKVSESQKCAQSVLSSNERHKLAPHKTGWLKQLTPMNE